MEHRPDGVVHVVLDGPATLNAQDPDTWRALRRAADKLPAGTRAVVLRGAGRAFSSGLARSAWPLLEDLGSGPLAEVEARIAGFQEAFTCWRQPGVLSVAAVSGPAVGAGFQLALACDLRLADDTATFRMAETSLGLVPDLAGTRPLVRAVGEAAALEICLSGRTVAAQEARTLGLVRAVVPQAELAAATDDLVAAVLTSPASSAAATLDLLRGADGRDAAHQLVLERAAQARLLRGMVAPGTGAGRQAATAAPVAEGPGPGRR